MEIDPYFQWSATISTGPTDQERIELISPAKPRESGPEQTNPCKIQNKILVSFGRVFTFN